MKNLLIILLLFISTLAFGQAEKPLVFHAETSKTLLDNEKPKRVDARECHVRVFLRSKEVHLNDGQRDSTGRQSADQVYQVRTISSDKRKGTYTWDTTGQVFVLDIQHGTLTVRYPASKYVTIYYGSL